MSDKKLGLDKLKVQSFVTSFSKQKSGTVKGGSVKGGYSADITGCNKCASADETGNADCPPFHICVCEGTGSGGHNGSGLPTGLPDYGC